MIYTICLNPSLDYNLDVENFTIGNINRSKSEKIFPGGKGINVSRVIKNLGEDTVTLGFIAGFTGREIRKQLDILNINNKFIEIEKGNSRINVKINSKKETAINCIGPKIDKNNINKLINEIEKINDGDYLVLAGNIPNTLADDTYYRLMTSLKKKNINFVVDTSGKQLLESLKAKPFLIKPNKEELEEIFSIKFNNLDQIKVYAKKLQDLGAKNILISLGSDGAILLDEHGKYHFQPAIKGTVISTVGSGDSMVAGFIYEYIRCQSYKKALAFACACGSATAFSNDLASKEKIMNTFHMQNN